jgi:eukaryotic-like serine/threonine-protein kinase
VDLFVLFESRVNPIRELKICRECGAKLSPRTLDGFCPACTARLTFDLSEEPSAQTGRSTGLDFGDYELLEEIGRGGMGVVYKARQRSLNRTIALKLILSGRFASKESVERLRAEASAAAALRHPNIVAIHEVGEVDGQHYFSMDYVAGRSLAEIVRERPVSADRAAAYVRAIAEAMEEAHRHGTLHRDLKPSNVLIDQHDQPHITDFGLAKRLDEESDLTVSGQAIGSPSYMPPEQAVGKRSAIGPHSDVYAMGALLYHLLTGRAPFSSETVEATLFQVLHNDPVSPRALNSSVPRDLETICLKCLEKEPARRYPTAQRLAEELRRFMEDEPILARPTALAEKFWRWCRRRPAVAGLLAALAVSLFAGFGAVLWQWQRAENHAQAETQQRRRAEALVERVELDHIDELLRANDPAMTLARLARLLRWNPTNSVAAERLMALLVQRDFAFPLMPALQHDGPVTATEFSPDGRLIVTASQDGTARLWDASSGQPVGTPMRHGAAVRSARFNSGGDKIVTASADKTARVWDAPNVHPLAEPIEHKMEVNSAEFSPDGNKLLTLCHDGVRVWKVANGRPEQRLRTWKRPGIMSRANFSPDSALVATVNGEFVTVWRMDTGEPMSQPMAHRRSVHTAHFSPDSRWLATACDDGATRIWEIARGEQRVPALRHGEAPVVEAVSFSPDGLYVVSTGRDRTARMWDAATGQPVGDPFQHTTTPLTARFSADGKRLVTTALDNAAYVWDVATGKRIVELIKHPGPVSAATFSPDGQRLLTACLDGKARMWDLRPGALEAMVLRHRRIVRSLHFNSDGTRIVTASDDGTACIWNTQTGEAISQPMIHSNWVTKARFSPDGRKVLTASLDRTVGIWDAKTGREVLPRMTNSSGVRYACFSPDGRLVAAACDNGMLQLWSVESGQPQGEALRHAGRLWHAEFSPDSQRVVTACADFTATIWDVRTRQPIGKTLQHGSTVIRASFSPDGSKILTASGDQTARLWDSRTGEPVGEPLRHLGQVRDAVFSRDGRVIATGSLDNTARLWDAATGQPLTEPLRCDGEVYSVQFSVDGRRLVTGAFNSTARVWDCGTGRPTCEPFRHGGRVLFVTFSPDDRRIATASADGTARLWDVPTMSGSPPGWLSDLAEAIAGQRLNAAGLIEPVEDDLFWQLKTQLDSTAAADSYTRRAQWFFANRDTRPISPSSTPTRAGVSER